MFRRNISYIKFIYLEERYLSLDTFEVSHARISIFIYFSSNACEFRWNHSTRYKANHPAANIWRVHFSRKRKHIAFPIF